MNKRWAEVAGGGFLARLPFDRATVLRLLLCLAMLYTAVMTAWVSDDAQISFRQIWNFVHGDGMTFNVGERVQSFTHPSWFLLLSGVVAVTRELFLTNLIVSMALSVAAIVLLLAAERRACPGRLPLLTPALLLVFSRAFCDYMASGLENPLSYFLIGLLLWLMAADRQLQRHRQWMFLLLALLALNRLDYALLFLPLALLLAVSSSASKKAEAQQQHPLVSRVVHGLRPLARDLWPGVALLLLWFGFALLYFGSPLPNTYYAKLGSGLPLAALVEKGMAYFALALQRDPITLVIILAGLVASMVSRNRALLMLALGQALYLGYVLQAGGDFMEGRFFAVPAFLAAGQMTLAFAGMGRPCRAAPGRSGLALAALLTLAVVLGGLGRFPFLTTRDYHDTAFIGDVADERGYYYRRFGLMSPHRQGWPQVKMQPDQPPSTYGITRARLGQMSLANPDIYLIDLYSLSSPFLARLPAIEGCKRVFDQVSDPIYRNFTRCQRTGHFMRQVPEGFGEYATGRTQSLPDARLNALFQDVKLAVRGPLFTQERLAALWRLNTGHHDVSHHARAANTRAPFSPNPTFLHIGAPSAQ